LGLNPTPGLSGRIGSRQQKYINDLHSKIMKDQSGINGPVKIVSFYGISGEAALVLIPTRHAVFAE